MGGGSAMLTKNGAWPTVCQMMQVRKDEVGVKALVEVRPFLPSLLVGPCVVSVKGRTD
ncbi:hypothetical protein BT69DRAFT_1279965, partial [Atractiella rhizophila]